MVDSFASIGVLIHKYFSLKEIWCRLGGCVVGLMREDANVATTSLDIHICAARKYGTSIGISAV